MAASGQTPQTSLTNHKENTYDTVIALFHFATEVKRRLLKFHLQRNNLDLCDLLKDKRQEIWMFEDVKQALRKSSVVRLKDLSLNTLNYILKFYCNDLFWNSCLDDGKLTFEDFLNIHSSEIHDLTECTNADNSSSYVIPNSTLLSTKYFDLLFNRSYSLFSIFGGRRCKLSAKPGIKFLSLNQNVHDVLLNAFCPLRRAVNCLTDEQRTICKIVVFKENIKEDIWTSIQRHSNTIAKRYKKDKSALLKIQSLRNSYFGEKQCLENRKQMLEDSLNDVLFLQDQGFCDRIRQELYSLSQEEKLLLIQQLCCKEISVVLPHGQYKNGMYKDAVLNAADKELECLHAVYCSEAEEAPFDTFRKKDRKSDHEKIETHNYLKLIQLVMEVGRSVFVDVLKNRLPGAHYGHAFVGMRQRLCPYLDSVEYAKLFPNHSVYSGDLTDLDLSLLYIILRNLNTIPPHSKGWGKEPEATDRSISANLDRIRIAKNKYVSHFHGCLMPYDMFKKAWEEIRQCIVELGDEHYKENIDTLLTTAINPLMERDLNEAVERLKKTERFKKKDVERLEEDISKVKEELRTLKLTVNTIIKNEEAATGRLPLPATLKIEGNSLPTVQELEGRLIELERDCEDIRVASVDTGSIIFGLVITSKSYQSIGFFLHVIDGFLGKIFSRQNIHGDCCEVIIVSMEITVRNIRNLVPLSFKQIHAGIDMKQIWRFRADIGKKIEPDKVLKRLVHYCIITEDECSMLRKFFREDQVSWELIIVFISERDSETLRGLLFILYEMYQHNLLHKWKPISDRESTINTEFESVADFVSYERYLEKGLKKGDAHFSTTTLYKGYNTKGSMMGIYQEMHGKRESFRIRMLLQLILLTVIITFVVTFIAVMEEGKKIKLKHELVGIESSLSYVPSYVTKRPYQYSARYDVRQTEYNYGNKIKALHQQCVAQTNEWSMFTYLKDVVYRWFSGSPSCDEVMIWVNKPTQIMNQADVND